MMKYKDCVKYNFSLFHLMIRGTVKFNQTASFGKRYSHDLAIKGQKVFQRQGPGGRSSNNGTNRLTKGLTATVFGATGFVGRNLVNQLGIFMLILVNVELQS
jgi:hypothetical protein